ncbi:MAG: glycosyltransferase family 39 protein [Candidatus Moraniibacteriota bacterium]
MKNFFSSLNQKLSWHVWVLIACLCIGIFLRTYNFHDWLRFNADQSRDAVVVSDYLDGTETLPLLGPKAGGTGFRVGPAFYYFQIAGAKIFGNDPDKMAYPDLLFSLLAIPLLFFFLRKYFDIRTALLLTAIFSVSFYAIKYSRFAWNPNSLPFWSLLFLSGLHAVMTAKEEAWKGWAVLTGVALGIGVQLHTLSLLLFPMMTFSAFGYLWYLRKKNLWKMVLVICATALFLNAPQIASEWKTGGENTSAFLGGIGTKEERGSGLVMNAAKDIVCFSQGNTYIVSSYDSSDTCELTSIKRGWNIPAFMLGLLLFLGGFGLAIRAYKREAEQGRKLFLGIFILYASLTFLLLLPLANEISMRFFLAIMFMPFVFLGLWSEFLTEKFSKIGSIGAWSIGIILVAANLLAVQDSFATSAAYLTNSNAGMDNVLLKEVELSSAFIIAHAGEAQMVAVEGDAKYLFKALKSMQYYTHKAGIKLVQKNKKTDPGMPVFLIENTKSINGILENRSDIVSHLSFGRFTIFSLK